MEERSNNKDKVTKTRDFSWKTIKKLENGKIIYRKVKESNKEAVQQEKTKFLEVKAGKKVWRWMY